MHVTEDAQLQYWPFLLTRMTEQSAKTALDVKAHVNTSFFNMVYYHEIKTNKKTHLWREL